MNIIGLSIDEPFYTVYSSNDQISAIADIRLNRSNNTALPLSSAFYCAGEKITNVETIVFSGHNSENASKIFSETFSEQYNYADRKNIIQYGFAESVCTGAASQCMKNDTDSLIFCYGKSIALFKAHRKNNIITLYGTDFLLDPDNKIAEATSDLVAYSKKSYDEIYETVFCLPDYSAYESFKNTLFSFLPDGRIEIKESIAAAIELLKTKCSDDIFFPVLLSCIKKLTEDICIHFCNYIHYITKNNELIVCGETACHTFSSSTTAQCQPIASIKIAPFPEHALAAFGCAEYGKYVASTKESSDTDREKIRELLESLFLQYRLDGMKKIEESFPDRNSPIYFVIKDCFEQCFSIKFTFDIRDIIISKSGHLAWADFYFFIFACYKDTGWPFIVNHKCISYFTRTADGWQLKQTEFSVFDDHPVLTIETTDTCNFSCIMCDQSRKKLVHNTKKGIIDPQLYKSVIDSLDRFKVSTITPFWLGEAMLHPQFENLLRYSFKKNEQNSRFMNFTINTNGSLLTKNIADAILDCAGMEHVQPSTFIRIHFSIDAATASTFNKIHQRDLYNKTVDNIRYFIQERARRGLTFPNITTAFIIMPENRHEASDFLSFWKSVFDDAGSDYRVVYDWPVYMKDSIYFRRLDSTEQAQAEQLHKEVLQEIGLIEKADPDKRILCTDSVLKEQSADVRKFIRRPCPGPFKTPIINWNGDVTVCCFDINLSLKIGNIKKQPLPEIWTGNTVNKWRLYHIRGEFEKIPLCHHCANLNAPVMSNADFVRYLIETGMENEIQRFLDRVGMQL